MKGMVAMQRQDSSEMTVKLYGTRRRATRRTFSMLRILFILLCLYIGVCCVNKLIASHGHSLIPVYYSIKNMVSAVSDSLDFSGGIQPDNSSGLAFASYQTVLRIRSTNAVLVDIEEGKILFEKNAGDKMYPASMAKIMTAVVALEHIDNLNERITLREEIFQPIYSADAATAGFLPGENVRSIDLFYGLLLPSGAECALGLAEYVAGSEEAFVYLMNEKARKLGMRDSNFTNTTGLHDKNQYSTAVDMAVLFQYALENDWFYQIITSESHSTASTNLHNGGVTLYSTLFSRLDSPGFEGGLILGGKTGFTNEAGQCLASLAEKDGKKYLLITSGAYGNNQTQKLHIDDAFNIYSEILDYHLFMK